MNQIFSLTAFLKTYTELHTMSSLREKAYEKIRDLISHGEFGAGERLVEAKISEIIGVGRTPIREAFRRLEAEGYVDISPSRGAIVKKVSLDELREIYELIALLEGYATQIATEYIKPSDIKELKAIQNKITKAGRTKDYRTWMEQNAQFHSFFPKLCRNTTLSKFTNQLRRKASRYRLLAVSVPGSLEEYIRCHNEILDAVSSGESQKAGKKMRKHVLDAKEKLFEFLKQAPGL